jgi:hypothetical protein
MLKEFPFMGTGFALALEDYVDDNEEKLMNLNPRWANGVLFDIIRYNISKDIFTCSKKDLPVRDVLQIVSAYRAGSFRMLDPSDLKVLTGHSVRQLASIIRNCKKL